MAGPKNILFIGDLRLAGNYGAIATTETLIRLLEEYTDNDIIKYLDYRSFHRPTPPGGWDNAKKSPGNSSRIKARLAGLASRKVLLTYLKHKYAFKSWINKLRNKSPEKFLPYKFSVYERYYNKMTAGNYLPYEYELLEWADIVYINGEGNIVNGTDKYGHYRSGGLYILFMAWLAKFKFKKYTCIVNHTVDPANSDVIEMVRNIYPKLDKVYVREPISLSKLHNMGLTDVKFVPDALFNFSPSSNWEASEAILKEIDFSKPYICIGDSSGIKNKYNQVKWDVVEVLGELVRELKKIIPQVIFIDGFNGHNNDILKVIRNEKTGNISLSNCNYKDLFNVLQRAEVFISGRWHASILSALAETPFLLWGSDSHKTKSLYAIYDYKYPFFEIHTLPIHIDDIVETTDEIIRKKNEISKLLSERNRELRAQVIDNVSFISQL